MANVKEADLLKEREMRLERKNQVLVQLQVETGTPVRQLQLIVDGEKLFIWLALIYLCEESLSANGLRKCYRKVRADS